MPVPVLPNEQLKKLTEDLLDYGRNRFPPLRGEMEDLVNESLADVVEYIRNRAAPGDAGSQVASQKLSDPETLRRLAFTVLKRRAVDAMRLAARRWTVSLEDLPEATTAAVSSDDLVRRSLLRQMLRVCIAELARMPPSDRTLLSIVSGISGDTDTVLSERDRQRLHRIRMRLAAAVREQLGEAARTLLREDI